MIHLFLLHETGSNNPIGIDRNFYTIPFHIYFTLKDTFGFILFFIVFIFINLQQEVVI